MKKHFDTQLTILKNAASFDEKRAEKLLSDCVGALSSGNSIIATALGKNVPICEKFVGTLNSLSVKARFMHTSSAIHGDLGIVQKGDVVIVLSKSGDTEETLEIIRLIKERGVLVWLLVCKENSAAGLLADKTMVLRIDHEGDPWNLVPNISSLVFLVFLQALCMSLIDVLPIGLADFKKNHPGGAIGKALKNM